MEAPWGIFKFINDYTAHGQTISVPNLEGLTFEETETLLQKKGLRFTILDSIYVSDADLGVVLEQNPSADALVKQNRTIYITISKVSPPKVAIPDIIGISQRLAIAKLESYGFKVNTKYVVSEFSNNVVKIEIDGKEFNFKEKVNQNSILTLYIGLGQSNEKVLIPFLVGLDKQKARKKLRLSSLNVGLTNYENCKCKTSEDSLNAEIYKNFPSSRKEVAVNKGSSIDLYFTCDSNLVIQNALDTIIPTDTLSLQ